MTIFRTTGPLGSTEQHLFVGRTAELDMLQQHARDVRAYVAILGARQIGKTSLLERFRLSPNLMPDGTFACVVDFQRLGKATREEMFLHLAQRISVQLPVDASDPLHKQAQGVKGPIELTSFLGEVSNRFTRVVLMIDELDGLPEELAIDLAGQIRSLFSNRVREMESAKYFILLAGSFGLDRMISFEKNSPLRNVVEVMYLGDLSEAETAQLTQNLKELGKQIEPGVVDRIYEWTGGHPYLTQQVCSKLEVSKEISLANVDNVVEDLMVAGDSNLNHVLEHLRQSSRLNQMTSAILSGEKVPFSRSVSLLAELELVGVIKNDRGQAVIRNRLYAETLKRYLVANQDLKTGSPSLPIVHHSPVWIQIVSALLVTLPVVILVGLALSNTFVTVGATLIWIIIFLFLYFGRTIRAR